MHLCTSLAFPLGSLPLPLERWGTQHTTHRQRRVPVEKPCADLHLCTNLAFPLGSLPFPLERWGTQQVSAGFLLRSLALTCTCAPISRFRWIPYRSPWSGGEPSTQRIGAFGAVGTQHRHTRFPDKTQNGSRGEANTPTLMPRMFPCGSYVKQGMPRESQNDLLLLGAMNVYFIDCFKTRILNGNPLFC